MPLDMQATIAEDPPDSIIDSYSRHHGGFLPGIHVV